MHSAILVGWWDSSMRVVTAQYDERTIQGSSRIMRMSGVNTKCSL